MQRAATSSSKSINRLKHQVGREHALYSIIVYCLLLRAVVTATTVLENLFRLLLQNLFCN
eukprot:m.36662 g.36662  ORF g.36662 m.36662 type:complete len:60 (-) comp11295_c0_seq1:539-718(-)